jgi:Family of unknown function (DUF6176)
MRINVYKVKKGKEKVLLEWGEIIRKEKNEALVSLREENCLEESLRLYKIDGYWYAIGVMCAAKGGKLLPHNQNRKINQEHFRVLEECLEEEMSFQSIYNVRVEDYFS